MKILIVKNKYKKSVNFKKGIANLEKNTPLKYEIDELETDFDFTFRKVGNNTFKGVVVADYYDKLRSIAPEGKYDVICVVYGNKASGIRVSIAENVPLYPNTDVIQVVKLTDGGKTFEHEMFHVFFYKLARKGVYLSDPMDTYKSNATEIALGLIAPHWNKFENKSVITKIMEALTPKPVYLYFSEKEVVGLKPELVRKLDAARDIAGVPFKINSGHRTEEQNKKVGGVKDSAHTTGEAVDIACTDSVARMKILTALLKVGFNRIGVDDQFLHCDISKTLPQGVIWLYK